MQEFLNRWAQMDARGVGGELVVLALCVTVAWGVARWLGRGRFQGSIWFGRRVIDGLLFPLLALLLADLARRALSGVQPVLVLDIAVPVFVSLAAIRLVARVLSAVFPDSAFVRLVERTVSWLAWLGAALWIAGLLPAVLVELEAVSLGFGKTRVSLRTLLEGALSAGVVLVLALWIAATVEQRILSRAVQDLSMRKVAANATRAVLLLVGLLFALSAVGVDLTALSVLGGALGVGLGFGLQKLAANYVSGFVILLERSIRIGDNVRIDNFEGRVTDIKTRYTLLRAGNGRQAIVPNESLIGSRVENLSEADRKFNLSTSIVVGSGSDVAQVRAILCDAALAQERVMREPAPVAYLVNFAPDGLEFGLHFWIGDPDKGQLNVRSDVNIAVLEGLRQAGIEIPSPQRVLRIESMPGNAWSAPEEVLAKHGENPYSWGQPLK